MSNEQLREYFLRRKKENEAHLADAQRIGFRLMQVTTSGDVDVTAEHIRRREKAIEDYQKAADIAAQD